MSRPTRAAAGGKPTPKGAKGAAKGFKLELNVATVSIIFLLIALVGILFYLKMMLYPNNLKMKNITAEIDKIKAETEKLKTKAEKLPTATVINRVLTDKLNKMDYLFLTHQDELIDFLDEDLIEWFEKAGIDYLFSPFGEPIKIEIPNFVFVLKYPEKPFETIPWIIKQSAEKFKWRYVPEKGGGAPSGQGGAPPAGGVGGAPPAGAAGPSPSQGGPQQASPGGGLGGGEAGGGGGGGTGGGGGGSGVEFDPETSPFLVPLTFVLADIPATYDQIKKFLKVVQTDSTFLLTVHCLKNNDSKIIRSVRAYSLYKVAITIYFFNPNAAVQGNTPPDPPGSKSC